MNFHDFEESKKRGESGELVVKAFLESIGYKVKRIGQSGEGTWLAPEGAGDYVAPDFLVESHSSGKPKDLVGKTLECKTDGRGHETGRFPIEVVSNCATGRPGWIHSTTADFVSFYCPGDGFLAITSTGGLRDSLKESWHRLRCHSIPNRYFTGLMLAVPREDVAKLSLWSGTIGLGA